MKYRLTVRPWTAARKRDRFARAAQDYVIHVRSQRGLRARLDAAGVSIVSIKILGQAVSCVSQ